MVDFNESDFEKNEQQSVPMKIAVPERLHSDVSTFAHYAGWSKTEFARTAFSTFLESQPVWKARAFFFQPNEKIRSQQDVKIEEKLKSASKGSLIKVASLQVDAPDRANMIVGNLVRIKGREVSFDIPNNYRPTHIAQNISDDANNVKMVAGLLVIPLIDNVNSLLGSTQRYIYTIDLDYVWDVDTNTPSFSL